MGFGLDWHFASGEAVLTSMAPILNPLTNEDKALFTVSRPDTFNVNVTTPDGTSYGVEPSKVFVGFQYMIRAKAVSGAAPVMEMTSMVTPFSKRLPVLADKLVALAMMVPRQARRRIIRVGVVCTTTVDEEDAPPGIQQFIRKFCAPWSEGVESYNIQITGIIQKDRSTLDRCVHSFTRGKDPDEVGTVMLDWQRTFSEGSAMNKAALEEISRKAQIDALAYFEEVAEGRRFYEDSHS